MKKTWTLITGNTSVGGERFVTHQVTKHSQKKEEGITQHFYNCLITNGSSKSLGRKNPCVFMSNFGWKYLQKCTSVWFKLWFLFCTNCQTKCHRFFCGESPNSTMDQSKTILQIHSWDLPHKTILIGWFAIFGLPASPWFDG